MPAGSWNAASSLHIVGAWRTYCRHTPLTEDFVRAYRERVGRSLVAADRNPGSTARAKQDKRKNSPPATPLDAVGVAIAEWSRPRSANEDGPRVRGSRRECPGHGSNGSCVEPSRDPGERRHDAHRNSWRRRDDPHRNRSRRLRRGDEGFLGLPQSPEPGNPPQSLAMTRMKPFGLSRSKPPSIDSGQALRSTQGERSSMHQRAGSIAGAHR